MSESARSIYAGYRFPPEIISHSVWLYFRFPLSLRMVEEMLAARGIGVSHETVRQWALKFGQAFANEIRRRLPRAGDKWHLDEVVITIAGTKHWLWRAVDQHGVVLDVLVQSRRDTRAAKRLLRKLLKRQGRAPRGWSRISSPAILRPRRISCPVSSTVDTKGSTTGLRIHTSRPDGASGR
jgi:putative transposase